MYSLRIEVESSLAIGKPLGQSLWRRSWFEPGQVEKFEAPNLLTYEGKCELDTDMWSPEEAHRTIVEVVHEFDLTATVRTKWREDKAWDEEFEWVNEPDAETKLELTSA